MRLNMETTPFENATNFGNNLATSLALHKALQEFAKVEEELTDAEKEIHSQMLLALLQAVATVGEA